MRALYNGMINKRPRLIARSVDAADGPGLGSCDDGLVIDLSMMKSVRVDPANRCVRRIRHKIANPTEILFCTPPVDRIEGTVPVHKAVPARGLVWATITERQGGPGAALVLAGRTAADRIHWSGLPGAWRRCRERHDPPAGLRRLGSAEVLADDEQARVLAPG